MLPPSDTTRVFISYARKDGAPLAQRLQKDLTLKGFNAWLDTQRIEGGATWTTKIERALDEAACVLVLMTAGSYISEICRAEQLRALRTGKCVIPIMAQRTIDIPLHLEAKNYRDFTVESQYAPAFARLLQDIQARDGIELKEEYRATYVTAPPLPMNFVERREELQTLRDALITDDGGRHIALTALEGMGGIGKTVLAQALCHDEVVQQAFPNGVIWISVGRESTFDAITRMREVGKALGDDLSRYDNELGAKNQYRSTIRSKAALIVVDDIWKASDLESLLAESPRSRLLFTTRDASIAAALGAREHLVNLLNPERSSEMLARWAGVGVANLPPIAAELIRESGRLPLALSMVGAMLHGKPAAFWKTVLELLRRADLTKIKAQFPDYPYTDVLRAIQVSADLLDEQARSRYLALAVVPEEMAIAPQVQQCLWGTDEYDAVETAEQFVSLSLAQRDHPEGSIRLHDLQLDYVRVQYTDKEALNLILGAVRLSSSVIANDPAQFSSQIVGRLLPYESLASIKEFIQRVVGGTRTTWLRPLQPTLHPPGTALVRTLKGHSGWVNAVALSSDALIAVSGSDDGTSRVWEMESGRQLRSLTVGDRFIKDVGLTADGRIAVSAWGGTLTVWDVASGRKLHTLEEHSGRVTAVALHADGRLAVSASADGALTLWNAGEGIFLGTLQGHNEQVNDVAISADGRLMVSASEDRTLKVWDVNSRSEVRNLTGHANAVNGVALSGDDRLAVSASSDNTVKIWELATGLCLGTLAGHMDRVIGVAVTSDGRRAVSASWDRTLKVWDVVSKRELRTLEGHSEPVEGVALTADGRTVVSASWDYTLKVWRIDGGRELQMAEHHADSVLDIASSEDGRVALSASKDTTVKVWDTGNRAVLRSLKGHSNYVVGVSMSGDGRRAVSASLDGTLKVWDVESGREVRTFNVGVPPETVSGVALNRDGRIAVATGGNKLQVWDVENGLELRTLSGHTLGVNDAALCADGRQAVSASFDETLKVWDVDTGQELRTLKGHTDSVWDVALSPDGRLAISGSSDATLKIWELASGRELLSLQGHSDVVYAGSVTRDLRLAVSASRDNTIKIWDLTTGAMLATFTCEGAVYCCAFINDRDIIAGDAGGRVYFLRLETLDGG